MDREIDRAREAELNFTLPEGWDDPDHLEDLDTLSEGQADDLKMDEGEWRVWLSRVTDEGITVERRVNGRWSNYWSNHEEVQYT